MPSQLLTEAREVLVLPSFPFDLPERSSVGLLWDPAREEVILEALPAITTPPRRGEVHLDDEALATAVDGLANVAEPINATAIFGGYLLRHFGHFMHESLSRLWWLSREASSDPRVRDACERLKATAADVFFFMPTWLDSGKDLPGYMAEVLEGLGLPRARIRILVSPTRFRRLLIPAQCWGFNFDQSAWRAHLGCDSRQVMLNLLGSYEVPPVCRTEVPPEPVKLYVTRSGLPLDLGRLLGDVLLDRLLEKAGFRIFHPERHSIAEQISLYSRASDLIFMDGSALYPLWFCRLQPGVRITVILRRRQGAWMCTQLRLLMPGTRGLRWRLLDALRSEGVTSEKDWESHNLADLAALARWLAPATSLSPKEIRETVIPYTAELVAQASAEQLQGILQELICQLLPRARGPGQTAITSVAQLAGRIRRRLRRLGDRFRARFISGPGSGPDSLRSPGR